MNVFCYFKFVGCDKACNGCTGDGPDMCIKCADDHYKKDNFCISTYFIIHGCYIELILQGIN